MVLDFEIACFTRSHKGTLKLDCTDTIVFMRLPISENPSHDDFQT
jgi:hypothetical protein